MIIFILPKIAYFSSKIANIIVDPPKVQNSHMFLSKMKYWENFKNLKIIYFSKSAIPLSLSHLAV